MVTVTDVQTNSGDRLSTNTTPNPGDAAESFELALTQQSQTLAQQNTVPFPSPSPGGGTVDLSPPSESANSLVDLIEKAFAGIPEGTAGIIGTRINAIPDELLKRFPQNIQDRIAGVAGTSAAVAFIFPPDSIQRLRNGGPIQGLIDVLLNTTLWLGIVPPSGPFNPSGNQNPPSLSDPFTFPGADAAYVMTARLNEGDIRRGVTVDFRAGWAYLNDIRPQNILQRQNPIVPDKADPDTWLFINAGITGSLGSVEEIPQAFTNGFEQLANGLSISSNSSGTPQFEFNAAGGGVVTAGALARIPTSERWTEALGNWLLNAGGASTATGVGAAWGAFLTALGVVFKQSTGLYVGPGWSVSRLTLDTSGELTYYSPNNRYSGNILDIPAAGTNLGASITRPINQDLATSIDNLASPTRTTLAQIIDTPTDLRDGEERANPTRLNLYWDEFLDSLPTSAPGVDLTTIADKLIAAYNNPNAAASEKANISHLWYQPDLEPARFIFENMLLEPATDKLIFPGSLNYGQDGVLGIEDLPALFDFAKQQWGNAPGDTNNYSSRLGRLARALYDAGWSELFNGNGVKDATIVPDLVNAIVAIENGVGQPAQENPLTDRVLPLYRFDPTQASNPDGVLVAIGDLDGLFTGPSDGAAPVLITPPAPSDAYRSIDESVGDLTTIAFRGQTSGFDIDFSNPDTQAALQEVEVVGLTDNDDIIRGDYTGRTVLGLGGNDTITIIDGGTVYADYSPAYVETYGPAQGLDPNNLPEGNDTIEVGDVTTGFIDAGGGNDRASINVTASVAADGTATINFPAGPGVDGTPGLTLDGGAGDGDTLVIRITNPVPYDPIFSAADLPANITNFENVELVYDLEPPPEPDPTPDPTPDPPPLYGYAYAADGGLMYHDGNGGFVIVPA